ncbi:formimidoylglutamate deiminase, partial [Streptomyces cellulosae]
MQVTTAATRTYWLEHAWLGTLPQALGSARAEGTPIEPGVALDVRDGRISAVRPDTPAPPPGAEVLRGLTLPGLANAHSHAFHRALRGTVQ